MNNKKVLFILHRSPPMHGAAKVGDFIASSEKLHDKFECRFISIKSSDTISDIGKVSFKKLYLFVELYIKVFWTLLSFRPQIIYFTSSIRGVAFYRDLVVSTLWKTYMLFCTVDIFYHYHTKGVNEFVSSSARNLKLTSFFLQGVNIVLLSPILKNDFEKLHSFIGISYLPNGVENTLEDFEFSKVIHKKFKEQESTHVLYLSNMIKSKGYFSVLKLAKQTKMEKIQYHFAGGWQSEEDEKEFFDYIDQNELTDKVSFHGFVNGSEKRKLLEKAHLFIFPTRNDAFPLSILEALSYGVPIISTDEGSIPYIVDQRCGFVLSNGESLINALEQAKNNLLNEKAAFYCRQRYLDNFSLKQFEDNLINLFKYN